MEISIGIIWVEKNNEWQIPQDWDPEGFGNTVAYNLNEVASGWNNDVEFEDFFDDKELPNGWSSPTWDTNYLENHFSNQISDSLKLGEEILTKEWKELSDLVKTLEIPDDVLAVPNKMDPFDWYKLPDEKKLIELGLLEGPSFRQDGVLQSDFGSFYFDIYRFGFFSFEIEDEITPATDGKALLGRIQADFEDFSKELKESPAPYGPGTLSHVCEDECSFSPCVSVVFFPSIISVWG